MSKPLTVGVSLASNTVNEKIGSRFFRTAAPNPNVEYGTVRTNIGLNTNAVFQNPSTPRAPPVNGWMKPSRSVELPAVNDELFREGLCELHRRSVP